MGNPFQDQLLKAGLVSKKQVKKAKHDQRVNKKKNTGKEPAKVNQDLAKKQRAENQRIQELNNQRNIKTQQKEKVAQIKQLILDNRQDQDDRGEAYNFVDDNKIKRIYINDNMADQLSSGQLAIVKLKNNYEIVPAKVAQQINKRDASFVVTLHNDK